MIDKNRLTVGSVVIAMVPIVNPMTGQPPAKARPVIVMGLSACCAEVAFITSQKVGDVKFGEVALSRTEAEIIGLTDSSKIDFGRILKIDFGRVAPQVIGHIDQLPKAARSRLDRAIVEAQSKTFI